MSFSARHGLPGRSFVLALLLSFTSALGTQASADATAFTQSLATASASDEAIAAWYRKTGYQTLWTGAQDAARRGAFLNAIATAHDHGLPVQRYDATALRAAFAAAETEADRGLVEVAMTRAYLAWARDLTSGALEPKTVDAGIVREIDRIDPQVLLARMAAGDPEAVLAWLLPKSHVYMDLMKAKIGLERKIATGGWGATLAVAALGPQDSGAAVVALRDRLVRMGYLAASASQTYDRAMQAAVQEFQLNHGLTADGVAGESTVEEINVSAETRLESVIVAMERERWLDIDRSARLIWVNLPDFTAKIMDHGKTVFQTRAVVGKNVPDQRTPEFSDQMEHMVINPSWGVPRSIIVKEYLPLLQQNPNAVGHLQVVDGRGRVVSRGSVNFAAYNARNFPYALRQPPSDGNALGLVKFMFPNQYNIYLHDTPSKSLFDKEVRAFSHGCIRLADPFAFAHALLSVQSTAVEAEFDAHLKTGRETTVKLLQNVPVHLVYFTAYPTEKGKISYRRDIYGRDAALYQALTEAGVALGDVQG
jgi:L,D-transpeptidase YcbB